MLAFTWVIILKNLRSAGIYNFLNVWIEVLYVKIDTENLGLTEFLKSMR